jgi:hypothetical protein
MKLRKSEPCLAILAALLLGRFAVEALPYEKANQRNRPVKVTAALGAEHLLAQRRCVSSHLFNDPRTAHLLPIVSPELTNLLKRRSRSHPFEAQSPNEVQTELENIHGIGPKKSSSLVSYLCTDNEG